LPVLEPLRSTTPKRSLLADEIVERLVRLILDQGLRPGDRLPSERQLMVQLAVGRSSLREAMKALSVIGIVDVSVGSGTFVADGVTSVLTKPLAWALLMGEKDARDLSEARQAIEGQLAALAAQRATPEDLMAIGERLALMGANLDDAEAFTRYDLEFHLAIARAAHSEVLARVVETLRHLLHHWFLEVYSRVEDKRSFVAQHAPIYEAIRARDAEGARRAMIEHLDNGLVWLLDSLHRAKPPSDGIPDDGVAVMSSYAVIGQGRPVTASPKTPSEEGPLAGRRRSS
jgi:GntR family transcriptional repressor for pyruvate dehydrogenase complex